MDDTVTLSPKRVSRAPRGWASPFVHAPVCGFLGSLIIAATAPLWRYADDAWRLSLPGVPHAGTPVFTACAFVTGCLLLIFSWARLSGAIGRDDRPVAVRIRIAAQTIVVWALPIALGPPLLSNDVYSYAAQGEIGSRGLDPTVAGPWVLGGGPFWRAADDIWHYNPSPYGPLWNKLAEKLVVVTGHDPAASVWAFRVIAVLAVVLSGWAVVGLARRLGTDPAVGLLLAVGNPVVLLHFVGGIHNDALMMAFLLVGVRLVHDRRRGLAFLFLAASLAIKLPGVVGLAYLGWTWVDDQATWLRRNVRAAAVTLAGFALVIAVSYQFRMSQGWITALKGTGKVRSTYSLSTMTGLVLSDGLSWLRFSVDEDVVVEAVRFAFLLVAAALSWWLLSRSRRLGVEVAIGLTLAAIVVLGPVLWPWYLPPALALLAVCGGQRIRPAFVVWCSALTFSVFPATTKLGLDTGLLFVCIRWVALGAVVVLSVLAQRAAGQPALPRWLGSRTRDAVDPTCGSQDPPHVLAAR